MELLAWIVGALGLTVGLEALLFFCIWLSLRGQR